MATQRTAPVSKALKKSKIEKNDTPITIAKEPAKEPLNEKVSGIPVHLGQHPEIPIFQGTLEDYKKRSKIDNPDPNDRADVLSYLPPRDDPTTLKWKRLEGKEEEFWELFVERINLAREGKNLEKEKQRQLLNYFNSICAYQRRKLTDDEKLLRREKRKQKIEKFKASNSTSSDADEAEASADESEAMDHCTSGGPPFISKAPPLFSIDFNHHHYFYNK